MTSRFGGLEIIIKYIRQFRPVFLPVAARGKSFQAGDPVGIKLMHGGINTVALQPAIAKRAGIA